MICLCDDALEGKQIRDVEKTLSSLTTQYENIVRKVYVSEGWNRKKTKAAATNDTEHSEIYIQYDKDTD